MRLGGGSRSSTGRRRSWSSSISRSAASSDSIRASTAATCSSERSRRNSSWCSSSSSSKMSASSSLSAATAFMISSPSSCEAASTRSAIWAACSRPRRRWVRRRRELGTCPTNGSRCVHSTSSPSRSRVPAEAPRQQPPQPAPRSWDRSRPPARPRRCSSARPPVPTTSRAVSTLIRLWPSTSARSSTSPGRRSNWARLSLVVEVLAAATSRRSMRSAGTNSSRPPMRAFRPDTSGSTSRPSRRTTTSWTRPSFAPDESSSGLPATEERCTTSSDMARPKAISPLPGPGQAARRAAGIGREPRPPVTSQKTGLYGSPISAASASR